MPEMPTEATVALQLAKLGPEQHLLVLVPATYGLPCVCEYLVNIASPKDAEASSTRCIRSSW